MDKNVHAIMIFVHQCLKMKTKFATINFEFISIIPILLNQKLIFELFRGIYIACNFHWS